MTMGLLDSVLGAIGGAQGGQGGGQAALINAVIGMLANQGGGGQGGLGGLGGLIGKFQQGGLGDVVGSWVGTGQNLPVSPDQLSNVLGSDTIGNLAQQLGLSHGDVAGQLSHILPQVVDKLTPHGQVPEGGLGDVGSLLGQLLGGNR
jgi:uncharacterized protein YidB (DUF937 family)